MIQGRINIFKEIKLIMFVVIHSSKIHSRICDITKKDQKMHH